MDDRDWDRELDDLLDAARALGGLWVMRSFPLEQAAGLAARARGRGYEAVIAPHATAPGSLATIRVREMGE